MTCDNYMSKDEKKQKMGILLKRGKDGKLHIMFKNHDS